MNELQRILHAFDYSQRIEKRAILATVVRTRGSVYRRPGARMLITEDGKRMGAISGGCLESDILERSHSLFRAEHTRTLVTYDTTSSDDIVFGLGLGCSGVVEVLLESLDTPTALQQVDFIRDCLSTQRAGAIATIVSANNVPGVKIGDRLMMRSDTSIINLIPNSDVAQALLQDAQKILTEQQTRVQSYTFFNGQIDVLLELIRPPLPLLLFGAGYDAIPVVQLAKQLGWHVTVIDHRPEYLMSDRVPHADQRLCCQPHQPETYRHLLTPQTAAVVMTHRYLCDLALLETLVPAPLKYLGVLGPKRRMQQLWQDLAGRGIAPTHAQHQRLYNPVGLDIGAETPEEIALSLIAEIQAVVGGRAGYHLRDRAGSIHSPQSPCLELAS